MAPTLETCLAAVEQHVEAVADALLQADATVLESATIQLREAAAALALALRPAMASGSLAPDVEKALGNRIRRVAEQLVMHRDNLARRAVAVDRQLNAVLPSGNPLDAATYEAQSARPGATPARIYDARVV